VRVRDPGLHLGGGGTRSAEAGGAHLPDLKAAFGAFVAGIAVKSSGVAPEANVERLRSGLLAVLVPVFFATAGLRLNILGPEMYPIIVLVAIVTSTMAPPLLRVTMRRAELTQEEKLRDPVNRPPEAVSRT
jgi:Kef-type K+ transport system membrane component KefB